MALGFVRSERSEQQYMTSIYFEILLIRETPNAFHFRGYIRTVTRICGETVTHVNTLSRFFVVILALGFVFFFYLTSFAEPLMQGCSNRFAYLYNAEYCS